jgi:NADH dehydrogenase [ubiquinone] 1 alpha subcomplex assembly factor 7
LYSHGNDRYIFYGKILQELEKIIIKKIEEDGFISITDFWQQALTHPSYGYYQKQNPFGENGDFITAPEASQLFGEMLGIWVYSKWHELGFPKNFYLVELGPGNGALMVDLLRATKHVAGFHDAIQLCFVEISQRLQKIQQQKINFDNAKWFKEFTDINFDAPIIVIANEFFDALPVEQYIWVSNQCYQRVIKYDNGFYYDNILSSNSLVRKKHNKILEISEKSEYYIMNIINKIKLFGGGACIIDYGYFVENGNDTIQAMQNHQYSSIFTDIGNCDITSHVNFARMIDILEKNSVLYNKYTQRQFLLDMGIKVRLDKLLSNCCDIKQKQILINGYERITNAEMMGELFKLLIF